MPPSTPNTGLTTSANARCYDPLVALWYLCAPLATLLGAVCVQRLTAMTGVSVEEAKSLICDLCRQFYDQGWVSGTGGGISVKAGNGQIVMAPSGVQKERMQPSDMFVLDNRGEVVETPKARPPPYKPPKLSECSPLFMSVSSCLESQQLRPAHTTWAARAVAEFSMGLLYVCGSQKHAQCGRQRCSVFPNHMSNNRQDAPSPWPGSMAYRETPRRLCTVGCQNCVLQEPPLSSSTCQHSSRRSRTINPNLHQQEPVAIQLHPTPCTCALHSPQLHGQQLRVTWLPRCDTARKPAGTPTSPPSSVPAMRCSRWVLTLCPWQLHPEGISNNNQLDQGYSFW